MFRFLTWSLRPWPINLGNTSYIYLGQTLHRRERPNKTYRTNLRLPGNSQVGRTDHTSFVITRRIDIPWIYDPTGDHRPCTIQGLSLALIVPSLEGHWPRHTDPSHCTLLFFPSSRLCWFHLIIRCWMDCKSFHRILLKKDQVLFITKWKVQREVARTPIYYCHKTSSNVNKHAPTFSPLRVRLNPPKADFTRSFLISTSSF